jgi:hypothetical protein
VVEVVHPKLGGDGRGQEIALPGHAQAFMVPMALGLGDGGKQNAPLGRAVTGGLANDHGQGPHDDRAEPRIPASIIFTVTVVPLCPIPARAKAPARSALAVEAISFCLFRYPER